DLGVFHRQAHVVKVREALIWSGVWVGMALLFNLFVYFGYEYPWLGLELPKGEPDGRGGGGVFFHRYGVGWSLWMRDIFSSGLVCGNGIGLLVFGGAAGLSTSGPVLGHSRSVAPARSHDPGRGHADRAVSVDPVRLRGVPDLDRCQDALLPSGVGPE